MKYLEYILETMKYRFKTAWENKENDDYQNPTLTKKQLVL